MPIYAYRCESCGHAKDVLRRISDPVLTVCPVCGEETFRKQLTAAGFQLKGSGWYVTDFKGGKPPGKTAEAAGDGDAKAADSKAVEGGAPAPADAPKAAPADTGTAKSALAAAPVAASAPAPAPGPAPSGTGSAGDRQS